MKHYKRPSVTEVKLNDVFWTPYTECIRDIMLPYCFDKFSETGYVKNFESVSKKDGEKHIGPPFSDGLLFETITGACDFLAVHYDEKRDRQLDSLIETILSAQSDDGFICTQTSQDYPEKKWGENGGDIIIQHDLYDQGAFIEAAVAHYRATKKTFFLKAAVKCANNICSYIGEAPKHNIIPGHSLPEMAFVMLARLFKNSPELCDFAAENNVDVNEYLELVRFWYDNRGKFDRGRIPSFDKRYGPEYNQDTKPFSEQRIATGHAVRAGLCYAGAALAAAELDREDYIPALKAVFSDIVGKKMHISGGIGARHDIEGFDKEYDLPNNAYLETCAGIALAFFAAEMCLIDRNSKYFDIFELSLYNNILGAIGKDFKSYYYDNALVNDGTKNRWSWHGCPCCPPMLAKIYSSIASYVYSYSENELCINMYMGSEFNNDGFSAKISKDGKTIGINVKKEKTSEGLYVSLRIPSYAENFKLCIDGSSADYTVKDGYAEILLSEGEHIITVEFKEAIREIYANARVEADLGRVCFMNGKYLMCTEGKDNGGRTEFILSENQVPIRHNDNLILKTHEGDDVVLIPYYLRNNRVSENTADSKMSVWLLKYGWCESKTDEITGDKLYGFKNL